MSNLQPPTGLGPRNPLFIPEIACMVLESVSIRRQDGCNLAMVCKALFQSLMPRLWRTVAGIEQLLRLIPGTAIIQERTRTGKKITVTISRLALDEPWVRYWVYPRHITTLHALKSDHVLRVHGWNILFAKRKEFEDSLLPNLECLDAQQPKTVFDPINHLALFALFLSSSIRRLDFRDYSDFNPNSSSLGLGSEVLSLSALLLVNSFAASHSVTLPPHYNCLYEGMVASSELGIHEGCLGWFERLPLLTNLTRLFIHICAISLGSGEGLIVLGHLPHLEDLEIMGSNPRSQVSQGQLLPIPSSLFPRLRTLHLMSIPSTRILYHIWDSEAIMSKLTEVFIYPDPTLCPLTWNEVESRIVPPLSNRFPSLRYAGLFIKLQKNSPDDTQVSQLEVISVLLSHLSVSALSLLVGNRGWRNQHIPNSLRGRTFPLLKHLDVFSPLCRSELRLLAASLPNLQHISVFLGFEEFEHTDMIDNKPDEPASLQPVLVHVHYKNYLQPLDSSVNYLEENQSQITWYVPTAVSLTLLELAGFSPQLHQIYMAQCVISWSGR